jgi:hypothetical protein
MLKGNYGNPGEIVLTSRCTDLPPISGCPLLVDDPSHHENGVLAYGEESIYRRSEKACLTRKKGGYEEV